MGKKKAAQKQVVESSEEQVVADAVQNPEEEESWLVQAVSSVLVPGSGLTHTMQMVINVIFVILAVILSVLIFVDGENIHLKIMMGLLFGLVLSTNWFFSLILNNEDFHVIGEEGKDGEKSSETKKDK
eukprot:TRINITY_DN3744_c0_g3_i1.p1 TRINITY_DN3744_c0_g3~~TRINITY_DN3744_c0_g3_i1.p1  ORF type:complete len:128 (+),score=34.59 TRINITY_DN3744_c0_g3_i1:778-1161(+)